MHVFDVLPPPGETWSGEARNRDRPPVRSGHFGPVSPRCPSLRRSWLFGTSAKALTADRGTVKACPFTTFLPLCPRLSLFATDVPSFECFYQLSLESKEEKLSEALLKMSLARWTNKKNHVIAQALLADSATTGRQKRPTLRRKRELRRRSQNKFSFISSPLQSRCLCHAECQIKPMIFLPAVNDVSSSVHSILV